VSQTIPIGSSNAKIARRLDFIGAAAAICVVCRLAWQEDLSWIGGVAVCVAVVLVAAIRWPYGSLIVLIATAAMPVFYIEISGWNARPEHFGVAVVFIAVLVWMFSAAIVPRFDKLDRWIFAFVLLNFVSSTFASSAPAMTVRWALQNCLAICGYFLIRLVVRDLQTLQNACAILLGVGLLESVYGILCYLSNLAFGTSVGVQVGQYLTEVAAPFGTLYEPNLFGAYTASCASFFFALYLFRGHRVGYLLCFLVTAFAVVVSFSRAALLALVFATGYLFWKNVRRQTGRDNKKLLMFAVSLAVILILISGTIGRVITARFTNLFEQGLADETAISRFIIAQEAIQDIPGHVLFGRGTASFNLTFDWSKYIQAWAGEKTWIGNAPLRIVHDVGIVGLVTIIGFFVAIASRIRRIWKSSHSPNAIFMGLWAGSLVYMISFETTDGTILAFSWIQLGLLASAVLMVEGATETRSLEFARDSVGPIS
jgi:O-antigen ligase